MRYNESSTEEVSDFIKHFTPSAPRDEAKFAALSWTRPCYVKLTRLPAIPSSVHGGEAMESDLMKDEEPPRTASLFLDYLVKSASSRGENPMVDTATRKCSVVMEKLSLNEQLRLSVPRLGPLTTPSRSISLSSFEDDVCKSIISTEDGNTEEAVLSDATKSVTDVTAATSLNSVTNDVVSEDSKRDSNPSSEPIVDSSTMAQGSSSSLVSIPLSALEEPQIVLANLMDPSRMQEHGRLSPEPLQIYEKWLKSV